MTKLLLTGASGMLGKQILSRISTQKYDVYTVGKNPLTQSYKHFISDLTNFGELEKILNICQPEIVINCAAYVSLDFCEKHRFETDLLHQHAVSQMSKYPSVKSVYYISTDSVFDGQRGNYTEEDTPNPLNYYAQSKLNGEKETLKYAKKAYILRTNIIGFDSKTNKSLFEWAYQNLSIRNNINGFSNVYFNPLYVGNLAELILSFIEMECDSGIYNFASKHAISKYDFLFKIAEAFKFSTDLITPIALNNLNTETTRPLNTTLNTEKISNLGIEIPVIDNCIHNLVNEFLKDGTRV